MINLLDTNPDFVDYDDYCDHDEDYDDYDKSNGSDSGGGDDSNSKFDDSGRSSKYERPDESEEYHSAAGAVYVAGTTGGV